MATGRGTGGNVGGNAETRPLVIRNTNIAVTTLGSGQAIPTAALLRSRGSCNPVPTGGVQVTPVPSPVPYKHLTVSCRVFDPSSTKKKDAKNFMLRSIEQSHFVSLNRLKEELHRQLGSSIVSSDIKFDVGYLQGQTKVCMHSELDLKEVWRNLEKGNTCVLWCEGVGANARKKLAFSSSDSEEEVPNPRKRKKKAGSALERKNERLQYFVRRLQGQHKDRFSKVQYRLWAEMLDVGTYKSLDTPPSVPMFTGGKTGKPNQSLSHAFTEMASSIATALSGNSTTSTPTPSTPQSTGRSVCASSPGRLVEIRSKYIQQLKELHLLVEAGALTEQEYLDQKAPLLQQLKKMNPSD